MTEPTHHYIFDQDGDLHVIPIAKITEKQVRLKTKDPYLRTRLKKEEACFSEEEAVDNALELLDVHILALSKNLKRARNAQKKLEEDTYSRVESTDVK